MFGECLPATLALQAAARPQRAESHRAALARQSGVLERSAAAAERHIFWETKIGCSQNLQMFTKYRPFMSTKDILDYIRKFRI